MNSIVFYNFLRITLSPLETTTISCFKGVERYVRPPSWRLSYILEMDTLLRETLSHLYKTINQIIALFNYISFKHNMEETSGLYSYALTKQTHIFNHSSSYKLWIEPLCRCIVVPFDSWTINLWRVMNIWASYMWTVYVLMFMCEVPHFTFIPTPTANVVSNTEATTIITVTGSVLSLKHGLDCNKAPCQCVASTDTHQSSVRHAICSRFFSSATAILSPVHLGVQGSWRHIKSVHNHSITSKQRGR
jgi:hypothetical protein